MLITGRMKLKSNFRWSVLMRFHSLLRRLESVSVNWNNDELEPNSGSGFPASLGTASVGVFFSFPLSDRSSVGSLQKPVSGNELIILAPYLVYRVLMAHYWSCPETVKRNIDTNYFFTCYDPVTSVPAQWFFHAKLHMIRCLLLETGVIWKLIWKSWNGLFDLFRRTENWELLLFVVIRSVLR